MLTYITRKLGHAVLVLLLVDRRLRQIDQGGRVDVDVPVAGVDRRATRLADLLGHRLVGLSPTLAELVEGVEGADVRVQAREQRIHSGFGDSREDDIRPLERDARFRR